MPDRQIRSLVRRKAVGRGRRERAVHPQQRHKGFREHVLPEGGAESKATAGTVFFLLNFLLMKNGHLPRQAQDKSKQVQEKLNTVRLRFTQGGSATKYEIAGFFWWQGDKDSRDAGLSAGYEANLVQLINVLRKTFNAPKAPFVTASLGQTALGATSGDGEILNAMLNVGK
jgi:hypothetical protein